MLISDENSSPIEIKSIDEPIDVDYFWSLDLLEQDFSLTKLVMMEEFYSPTLTISINGKLLSFPADWHILVYSPDTSEVDMVQLSDLTKSNFSIMVYNHVTAKVVAGEAKVVEYSPSEVVRTPSFNKNMMLCHPVGDSYWLMVAPTDTYNKYLKNGTTVGNFLY